MDDDEPIERYDPSCAPDPTAWMNLDEQEQINLAFEYHRRRRIKIPGARVHAIVHAVVETQVAMAADGVVARTLARLQDEGLDRHDAIHAVGSVLLGELHGLLSGDLPALDVNDRYFNAVERLSAESWRRSG
ncbi:MAG: hypothetical protein HYR85_11840 [Planctomycetes bacterium]|nr:hypothetical protein [Planctomycetota bacterium]MBI3843974.1 hypothetical protein [Planctomycetota bacterium]